MDIFPAIDLVGGKCVRLIQGQYHRQITYEDDPVKQAKLFAEAGAKWLHIVDLEGAKVGEPINMDAVEAIVSSGVGLKIEIGGGVRNEEGIRQMLDAGVERVIIGTGAVSEFDWFVQMVNKFPHKLVLGLDARGSRVAIRGWTKEGQCQLWDIAAQVGNLPLAAIIYTDINKDGMMDGPNFERTQAMVDAVNIPVIAAGGVTELDDVVKLIELGVGGVVIGRALYEGSLDLKEAIKAARQASR